ncbi:hypothetical protein DL766_002086 [Monosporascus sp. MC13-8B]|uniref:Zn(2)-C6 fungal-type domain-containing protein n=1 Tax=Monosporascus cannonballus TaxID=155416 RepID=A0ABY0GXE5_9PEZI|nr:hypothetical protein DL762_008256 [Monosporascus cannonballus]RYO81683.1 hypothetical protein DL763_008497 [Monosporascus cannonballus]RYP36199.1 hypothetical protein DL766_002086 [Monosporascus sp. MC13-8B]
MSRPQVGIERLPTRRMSNEPRESMNCKSCRKRKIKCNRLRPACEACQVFQCPCIYDAVPKKRGPKTDVLEALLKRVDGLEARLKDQKNSETSPTTDETPPTTAEELTSGADASAAAEAGTVTLEPKPKRPALDTAQATDAPTETAGLPPTATSELSPGVQADALLDTYFTRFHAKPYHVLDESSVRQRLQLNQLPNYLVHAVYSVGARYTPHPAGYQTAVKLSEDYAARSRSEIELDEPSIDALQALLLLVIAFTAAGKGRKAYMLMTNAVGMAIALELHREVSMHASITAVEREMRRRLFWYLASGGVKGDSHFPWHALSNLSKIRQDLDVWASGTEDVFSSVDILFGQPDSTVLVLSKLIYHLIHCLIYRPFLPIDLAELAGTGQHQSWQIEATNMCFLHANAIAELVELGKQTGSIEWPAFVGYCICTAGTVHIHGAHYKKNGLNWDTGAFASSSEFLSREMQQLSELRYAWASVQHQRETLQGIYNAHIELVKSLANNPMRYSPVFHLEDFFDRYSNIGGPGGQTFTFDAANVSLADVVVDFTTDTYTGYDLYAPRTNGASNVAQERPNLKRKNTASLGRKRPDIRSIGPFNNGTNNSPLSPALTIPSGRPRQFSFSTGPHSAPILHSPPSLAPHSEQMSGHLGQSLTQIRNPMEDAAASAAAAAAAAAGFGVSPPQPAQQITALATTPFSPPYHYATPGPAGEHGNTLGGYDPMFGTVPTSAFSSPAGWHGEEGRKGNIAPSPGAHSHNGSTGTGSGEEKDPFLSLLEQLAESEHAIGQGNELDFFLAGAQG